MNLLLTNTSTQQESRLLQLECFRRPVEIIHGIGSNAETIQLLPVSLKPEYPVSSDKQAFLDMAALPMINLDEYNDSSNYSDCEDPEILLSDSDEEEDALGADEDSDADTCMGSDEQNDSENEDSITDEMDVFDEPRNSIEINVTHVY